MKILNTTIRDSKDSIQKTRLSELPKTTQMKDESIIHVAQYVEPGKYTSNQIEVGVFKKKIYEAVNNTLRTEYWDTHENLQSNTSSFGQIIQNSKDFITEKINESDDFVQHVNYDFNVLSSYINKTNNELSNKIGIVSNNISVIDCYFTNQMKLSVNQGTTVDDDACQMEIAPGNRISNEWVVPDTGNMVIYGWVDSSEALNNKAIPSSFCVVEGKINNKWEILAVQSVIPAKNITYVGFNLLVKRGLLIRIRTGFSVGAKSGQYPNEQDGNNTLSTSKPNGFKCQIYHHGIQDYIEITPEQEQDTSHIIMKDVKLNTIYEIKILNGILVSEVYNPKSYDNVVEQIQLIDIVNGDLFDIYMSNGTLSQEITSDKNDSAKKTYILKDSISGIEYNIFINNGVLSSDQV